MPLKVDGPRNEEFYAQISPNPIKQELTVKKKNLPWGTGTQVLSLCLEEEIHISLEDK